MTPLVSIRDLHYRYPDGAVALAGVDFELAEGETVALLGANGSGKTTFLLHLNGLLQGEGQVEVAGLPVCPDTLARIRQHVGFVFQDSDDQLFMPTVLEDVVFGPLNLGLPADEAERRARTALDAVGMAGHDEKAPYHLSAGEKKRVAIAGILAMEPALLVLDEPTTYLDPPGQAALIELLRGLPQAKIIATHDIDFALTLASRAAFFQAGRIVASGPVAEMIERFAWDRRPRALH